MNSIAGLALASGAFVLSQGYPQEAAAQQFTGAEFATWSEESQNGFMQTSVTMAGIVFTQTHPDHATCINDRYFVADAWNDARDELRRTILDHADAHPGGVVLAVILRDCGTLE